MSRLRLLIPIALVGSLGVLAWAIDSGSNQLDLPRHGEMPAVVAPGKWIFASGRVEGATLAVELRPQLRGAVAEVVVEEGQSVTAGQLLLRLDDDTHKRRQELAAAEVELAGAQLERLLNGAHQAERREARAEYDAAVAQLELAEKTWRRTVALRAANSVSEQNADEQLAKVRATQAAVAAAQARLDLLDSPTRSDDVRIAQARLQVARSQLQLAETELAKTRLESPVDATVLKVAVEPGELVNPSSAGPAIILADTRRLRVRAFVEELDAPRVGPEMEALITADGLPGVEVTGMVTHVSPMMESKEHTTDKPGEVFDTKVREVWISLAEDADLVVGLRVDVRLRRVDEAGVSR
jgi:HlyD family secretion protein